MTPSAGVVGIAWRCRDDVVMPKRAVGARAALGRTGDEHVVERDLAALEIRGWGLERHRRPRRRGRDGQRLVRERRKPRTCGVVMGVTGIEPVTSRV